MVHPFVLQKFAVRSLIVLIAALVMLLPGRAAAQSASADLPNIGSGANSALTLDDEHQIGRMVMRGLRDQGLVLEDPEATDYIQALGSRITSQIPESEQRFTFFVVREAGVNAFALPGGFVGVNYGLITATANESQLASVLAHEIAHVTQRHIARAIQAQGRSAMTSAAAMLAAILIGMTTGSADAVQAGIAVAQGAMAQQRINFTRANEYEADRIGISFLAAAGFDPNGMPDFFETLNRRSGLSGSGVPEFLRTHPVTANRIAESRDRAAQITPEVKLQTASYEFVRERVRVLGAPSGSDLRPFYAAIADRGPLNAAQRYGEALARLEAGDRDLAASALIELSASQPQSPLLQAALGQALFAAGQPDLARPTLQRALAVAPRNVPLAIRYAEVLLQTGSAKEAHAVLLDLFNNVPPTPEQIRLTALAASSAGDTGDAYYYMGEYHLSSGDLILAIKQLELALADPDITSVQRARFQARMKEVREALVASGKRNARETAGRP
ncbi:MAG: M48 family metallopeptidase [Gammaproteobacteria bacterium]|nr:M48 family metallopeptidase [Gammaproteobacteria bacterium]